MDEQNVDKNNLQLAKNRVGPAPEPRRNKPRRIRTPLGTELCQRAPFQALPAGRQTRKPHLHRIVVAIEGAAVRTAGDAVVGKKVGRPDGVGKVVQIV